MRALRSLSKVEQPYNNVSKVMTEIKLDALKRFWRFSVSTFEKVMLHCFKVSFVSSQAILGLVDPTTVAAILER